jgi:hypothetical protein
LIVQGCDCAACCKARWVEDVIDYARFLEEMTLEIKKVLDSGPGSGKRARRMIKVLAGVCERRALGAEIEAADLERDARAAAEAREAGRLH